MANIAELGNAMVIAVVVLCAVGGVGALGYAGLKIREKSGEYEPHGNGVKWNHIAYATLAGTFLLSISYVASTSIETLGGNSGDIGKSVNIAR